MVGQVRARVPEMGGYRGLGLWLHLRSEFSVGNKAGWAGNPLHSTHKHTSSKPLGLPLRMQEARTPIGAEFLPTVTWGWARMSTLCSTLQGPASELSSTGLSFQLFLLGLQLCCQLLGLKETVLQRVPLSPVEKHQRAGS